MTEDFNINADFKALTDLASRALPLWNLSSESMVRMINLSENATFLVTTPEGQRSILRIHRTGYHSHRAIECELAWMAALDRDGGVPTPRPIAGHNGQAIQLFGTDALPEKRMVMFEFLAGVEPDPGENLVEPFRQLGEIAARTHLHSQGWQKPQPFERLIWDDEMVFGASPTWGRWQDAPGVDARCRDVLMAAETLCRERLASYGRDINRFGLIHADMRLANLLIEDGHTRLIDFDDCGAGWFMYDFAAGISFMETHPQAPDLRAAWLDGYRHVRAVSIEDEEEIDSFIMLRRMALLAWIGSHSETSLARDQSPHFALGSAQIAREYLGKCG